MLIVTALHVELVNLIFFKWKILSFNALSEQRVSLHVALDGSFE